MKERSYWRSVEGDTDKGKTLTTDSIQTAVKEICDKIQAFDASEQNAIIKAVYHEIEDARLKEIARLEEKMAYLAKLNEEL